MPRPIPTDEEIPYNGSTMITETDKEGFITYANRKFVQMSGYAKEELLGYSHNIMRHPDMPKKVFKEMWQQIKQGDAWKGYIKNLRKDGSHYWAVVFITPKHDEHGQLNGFIAAREIPGPQTLETVKAEYAAYKAEE